MSNRLIALLIVLVVVGSCSALIYLLFFRNVATGTIHINATGATISFASDFTSDNFPLAGKIFQSTTRHTMICDIVCDYGDIPAIHYIIKAEKDGYETTYSAQSLVVGKNPDITFVLKQAKTLTDYRRPAQEIADEHMLKKSLETSYATFVDGILGYVKNTIYIRDITGWDIVRFSDGKLTHFLTLPSSSKSFFFDPIDHYISYEDNGSTTLIDLMTGARSSVYLSGAVQGIKRLNNNEQVITSTNGDVGLHTLSSAHLNTLIFYDDILPLADGSTLGLIRNNDDTKKSILDITDQKDKAIIIHEDRNHKRSILFSTKDSLVRLEKRDHQLVCVFADGTLKTLSNIDGL